MGCPLKGIAMITELEFKSLQTQGFNRIPLVAEAFAEHKMILSLSTRTNTVAFHINFHCMYVRSLRVDLSTRTCNASTFVSGIYTPLSAGSLLFVSSLMLFSAQQRIYSKNIIAFSQKLS